MTEIDNIPTEILPHILKQARTMCLLTLSDASTQTGISRTTLNRIESSDSRQTKAITKLVRFYEKNGIYIAKLKTGAIAVINTQAAITIKTTREVSIATGHPIQISTRDGKTTITNIYKNRDIQGTTATHPKNTFAPAPPTAAEDSGIVVRLIDHGLVREDNSETDLNLTTIIIARPQLYHENL